MHRKGPATQTFLMKQRPVDLVTQIHSIVPISAANYCTRLPSTIPHLAAGMEHCALAITWLHFQQLMIAQ